jgi:hypothetical protein
MELTCYDGMLENNREEEHTGSSHIMLHRKFLSDEISETKYIYVHSVKLKHTCTMCCNSLDYLNCMKLQYEYIQVKQDK